MLHDLRYALRVLRNNASFTAVAVLTLGLALGLNATIFTLFDALALRPLELPGHGQVVSVYQDIRGVARSVDGDKNLFSYAEYARYRDDNRVFSGLAAYMPEVITMVGSDPTPVRGQLVSCNYFSVLSAPIVIGRGFTTPECAGDDAGPVVILSDEFWRAKFAANPRILGQTVRFNRIALTVIGVAGPTFHGTELVRPSFWAPISMEWSLLGRQDNRSYLGMSDMSWLALVGRLSDGTTLAQARANLGLISRRIDASESGRTTTLTVGTVNLLSDPEKHGVALGVGSLFLVAVGLVLLIACANVANLFLARAASRQREIAVRLAIGASRGRLVRQLLTESAIVALAGGVLGTLVALWSAAAVARVLGTAPMDTPIGLTVGPDVRVYAYVVALVALTTLAFGLAPALHATRPDLNQSLKSGESGAASNRGRLRGSLVALQVATCMVLLITAGLFLRALDRAQSVDPGWQMDGAVAMSFDLGREGYTTDRAAAFTRELDARLRGLPGVVDVAEGTTTPLSGQHHLAPFSTSSMARGIVTEYAGVSAEYLASVNLRIVRGHDFTRADAESNVPMAIVNEAAARRFWPGEDPVGRTLHGDKNTDYQVVGVVRDAELSALGKAHEPYLFVSPRPADAIGVNSVIVRSSAPFASLERAMHTAAVSMDPDIHVRVFPLRDNVRPYVHASQLFGLLSSGLGGLGLLLAALGIYGTVAFTVARRTREIGIRIALGAHGTQVTRLIVRQAMRPVVAGATVGLVLCAAVSGLLAPVLFGVGGHDAVAFVGVPAFLLLAAAAASYAPARRAVRVNPVEALRTD